MRVCPPHTEVIHFPGMGGETWLCTYHLTACRDGLVVRALAFHQCDLGFDSRSLCHMWVEFVVGSRPCSEGFTPDTPIFLPP